MWGVLPVITDHDLAIGLILTVATGFLRTRYVLLQNLGKNETPIRKKAISLYN